MPLILTPREWFLLGWWEAARYNDPDAELCATIWPPSQDHPRDFEEIHRRASEEMI